MRHPFGQAARNVVTGGFKTFARAGEGWATSAPALWSRSRDATRCQTAPGGRAVGGKISQVLGRVARSPCRVFGKDEQSCRQGKGAMLMCPICVASTALLAAGATSSGGLT